MYPNPTDFIHQFRTAFHGRLNPAVTRCLCGLFMAIMLLSPAFRVSAQEGEQGGSAILGPVMLDRFPSVGFYLRPYNRNGLVIQDLKPEEVTVMENGQPRPLDGLQLLKPGVQFIVAVNDSKVFETQVSGRALFDPLRQQLVDWATSQPEQTPDVFSLVGSTGLQVINQENPQEWVAALQAYKPNLDPVPTEFASLSQALDLASEPLPNPLMQRVILYISPLPGYNLQNALPNLAGRAAQQGIRIFVWLVGPTGAVDFSDAASLRDLAGLTGGQVSGFSGIEPLPNPADYLEPLSSLYYGEFRSAVQASGQQKVTALIQRPDGQALSNELQFDVAVQPPNPMFLSPPENILRTKAPSENGKSNALVPAEQLIRILIEFPDGHNRGISQSQLFVDGSLVAENHKEPFDQFSWPLDKYETSGRHLLRVNVVDNLGLSQETIDLPVEIQVENASVNAPAVNFSRSRILIAGSVLFISALLGAALLLFNHRRMFRPSRLNPRRDPVTQPVLIPQETAEERTVLSPAPSKPKPSSRVSARMVPLDQDGRPVPGSSINMNQAGLTIGRDPGMSGHTLDSPQLEPVHAHLERSTNGDYILYDDGSVAGTYVNYTPVSRMGARIKHGDIIHFGTLVFRFEIHDPQDKI